MYFVLSYRRWFFIFIVLCSGLLKVGFLNVFIKEGFWEVVFCRVVREGVWGVFFF